MSILSVVIPVPAAGEGALVDVSALVGPKTVVLTGRFQGSYELLASQDDSHFVPVAQFDAGGDEAVRQTISGAFKSMRLRAATPTTVPVGVVTCAVSAVAAAGQNYFAVLANLAAGFSGTSAAIDLAPLMPLTGPEEDICLVCEGNFTGRLTVEGSLDGTRFAPIGSFRVDRRPEGAPATLELPVLSTPDKTRYLRASLSGQVGTGGTVVTVGGRVPVSGGTVGDGISPVDDSTSRSTTLDAAGEEILYEEPMDLDALAVGTPISARWSAVVAVSLASTGTFRLYVGAATPGSTAGGTVRATLTTSSLAAALASAAGAAFLNPGGKVLVQITGINNTPATCVSKMLSFALRMV